MNALKLAAAALLLAVTSASAVLAEEVEFSWRTSGTYGAGVNSFPFGNTTPARYEQIYSHSGFDTHPLTITGIAFQNYGIGYLPTTFSRMTISLSTTAVSIGSLGSSFDSNAGLDRATVFDDSVYIDTSGQTIGDYNLNFTFDRGFAYDPADGNLLVDIRIYGVTGSGAPAFASFNTGMSSRLWTFLPDFSVGNADNYSLNTLFSVESSVPEPGIWMMIIGGFGITGGAIRAARRARSSAMLA